MMSCLMAALMMVTLWAVLWQQCPGLVGASVSHGRDQRVTLGTPGEGG